MGEFAADPKLPSHEWGARVSETLQLYVDITDLRLEAWTCKLSFLERRQAITQVARKCGHAWIPFVGEDIAAMMATGKSIQD
eukprot:6657489-Pyramimonas_sp.AAC.1